MVDVRKLYRDRLLRERSEKIETTDPEEKRLAEKFRARAREDMGRKPRGRKGKSSE